MCALMHQLEATFSDVMYQNLKLSEYCCLLPYLSALNSKALKPNTSAL